MIGGADRPSDGQKREGLPYFLLPPLPLTVRPPWVTGFGNPRTLSSNPILHRSQASQRARVQPPRLKLSWKPQGHLENHPCSPILSFYSWANRRPKRNNEPKVKNLRRIQRLGLDSFFKDTTENQKQLSQWAGNVTERWKRHQHLHFSIPTETGETSRFSFYWVQIPTLPSVNCVTLVTKHSQAVVKIK